MDEPQGEPLADPLVGTVHGAPMSISAAHIALWIGQGLEDALLGFEDNPYTLDSTSGQCWRLGYEIYQKRTK